MKNKIFIAFTLALVLSTYLAFASPYFFKGVAHVNSSLAPNGTIIEAFIPFNASNPISSVTIGEGQLAGLDPGKYVISFEATSGEVVSLKINRIALIAVNGTNTANQTLGSEAIFNNFNLSINKSANTLACTFANGCTGGFCVHSLCRSASTFCGDSFCDSGETCTSCSSDCGACPTTSSGGGSGGSSGGGSPAGGGAATAPQLPSETQTVAVVQPETPTPVVVKEEKLPVSQVEITTTSAAVNVEVTIKEVLRPSAVSPPVSASSGSTYKYVDITAKNVQTTQISKSKIKFKVAKTWLSENSIDPNTVALNRLEGSAWNKLPTKKVGETSTELLYEAETPGFSTFAITGEKSKTPVVFPVCGNNVIESGEDCDEQQLAGQTCESRGYSGGYLKCTACRFDVTGCTRAEPERPAQPAPLPLPAPVVTGSIVVFALLVIIAAAYFFLKRPKRHERHQQHPHHEHPQHHNQ